MLEACLGSPPSVNLYKAFLYSSRKNILYFFSTATPLIVTSLPIPAVGRLAVGALVGGKGAALGAGAKAGVEVGAEVARRTTLLLLVLDLSWQ